MLFLCYVRISVCRLIAYAYYFVPSAFICKKIFAGTKNIFAGVTGQSIPPAGLYPGLKRPRLDYTRVYYGLGQFIPRGILWPRTSHTPSVPNYTPMISITISIVLSDIPTNYLIFQQVTEDSVLTGMQA